jgi:hypothetical protein
LTSRRQGVRSDTHISSSSLRRWSSESASLLASRPRISRRCNDTPCCPPWQPCHVARNPAGHVPTARPVHCQGTVRGRSAPTAGYSWYSPCATGTTVRPHLLVELRCVLLLVDDVAARDLVFGHQLRTKHRNVWHTSTRNAPLHCANWVQCNAIELLTKRRRRLTAYTDYVRWQRWAQPCPDCATAFKEPSAATFDTPYFGAPRRTYRT